MKLNRKTIIRYIAIITFLIIGKPSFAQDKEVAFVQGLSWQQVRQKAKAEHKYVFVDCFATWCGPCKVMDKYAYTDPEVSKFVNANFISVKVQMDSTGGDKEQIRKWYNDEKMIEKFYEVHAYPTFLFFDPEGSLVHRFDGLTDNVSFIGVCRDAIDPAKQYYHLLRAYRSGKRDTSFLKLLAKQNKPMVDNSLLPKIVNDYFQQLTPFDLGKIENLLFLFSYMQHSNGPAFSYFLNNADQIDKVTGFRSAERIVIQIITKEELGPYTSKKNQVVDWAGIRKTIKRKYGNRWPEVITASQVDYYRENKDWDNYAKYFVEYSRKYLAFGDKGFNALSWDIFRYSDNKEALQAAAKSVKYVIDMTDTTKIELDPAAKVDTYANLLYKLGQTADALTWEQKAVAIDPKRKDIVDNFEKMKKGERTW